MGAFSSSSSARMVPLLVSITAVGLGIVILLGILQNLDFDGLRKKRATILVPNEAPFRKPHPQDEWLAERIVQAKRPDSEKLRHGLRLVLLARIRLADTASAGVAVVSGTSKARRSHFSHARSRVVQKTTRIVLRRGLEGVVELVVYPNRDPAND